MKNLLLLSFISLQFAVAGQITFEEANIPTDFNIGNVRKSSAGEYFIQAANDAFSIYTSTDGQLWENAVLPTHHTLEEILFYSDGTPLLSNSQVFNIIRKNGTWEMMEPFGDVSLRQANFIKDDTLFVYKNDKFGFSVDKGLSYSDLFTPTLNIGDHYAQLWKLNNRYILFYAIGAGNYLSVFDEAGARIFHEALSNDISFNTYNNCGKILFTGIDSYYWLNTQDLTTEFGELNDLMPQAQYGAIFFSDEDHYYMKTDANIYKTTGCNFTWEVLTTEAFITQDSRVWIDDNATIYLYDIRSNHYFELAEGSNEWIEKTPDIDYALVYGVNESFQHNQVAHTSNFLFNKKTTESDWNNLTATGGAFYQMEYSPGGTLYINNGSEIHLSADNGQHFNPVPMPDSGTPFNTYYMRILDDGVIYLTDDFFWQSFYTINNGQDWFSVTLFSTYDYPLVTLVDNHILVANLVYDNTVTKININTHESSTDFIGDFYFLDFFGATFLDDGTLYFHAWDINDDLQGLFRYQFGQGEAEYVGTFTELEFIPDIFSSGQDLYAFDAQAYHVYDGANFETFQYSGLPQVGNIYFNLADNEHVYAIVENHRIFRSTQPLKHPKSISGSIYHHDAQDCELDTTDATLSHWQVKVENANFLRIKNTNASGQFNFSVPPGNYTVSSQPLNQHWELCEETYQVVIDDTHMNVNQDFIAKSLSACSELQIDFSTPLLRRCFDNSYFVNVRNTGPEETDGTILTIELDPFFIFQSATIPYTLVGDSILKFDLGVMELNDEISFQIVFTISCEADLGMEHCLTGILTDDNLCGTARSSYTECQENIGSFDPNDKRVFNEAGEEAERIDKGEYIYYHIRFQNTGTDTAFNIEILDPLSPILDLSTLEMLSASHPHEYVITDGPALKINFDNVLLVDSTTNEPASHGYFKFRIKPLPSYDYGTSIPNQAGIYFDFNEAVLTNEATLAILPPVGTKDVEAFFDFNIYPNPVNSHISLSIPETEWQRVTDYSILDPLGRIMQHSKFVFGATIEVSHLQPGFYTILLKEKEVTRGARKFAKL